MFRHILLPTDGSPLSNRASAVALKLAKESGARLTAFHVIAPFEPIAYVDTIAPYAGIYTAPEYKRRTARAARKLLDRVAARAKAAGVRCDALFAASRLPWRAIIKAARAKRCDLIVMASHGRRGLDAVLLGSETTKVLTHSKIPVLVCR